LIKPEDLVLILNPFVPPLPSADGYLRKEFELPCPNPRKTLLRGQTILHPGKHCPGDFIYRQVAGIQQSSIFSSTQGGDRSL
jgi:hypothetical protein